MEDKEEKEIRQDALSYAVRSYGKTGAVDANSVISRARKFEDYLKGQA